MRKMKDSGIDESNIGNIFLYRLKYVFAYHRSGAWGEEVNDNLSSTVCIRVADFNYDKLTISNSDYSFRHYQKNQIDSLKLKKGDILLEKSGGGEQTPVGRAVLFDKKIDALCSNFIEFLRPQKGFYYKFVLYLFATLYNTGISKKYIKQTTGIQNFDLVGFLSEKYYFPEDKIQKATAEFLDEKCTQIDETIEKNRQQIEKLKEYKQALITEAVTKGLEKSVPMKDSGVECIGEIPEVWEKVFLTKVLELIIDYRGKTPSKVDKGIFLVTAKNIKNNIINYQLSREYVQISEYNSIMRKGLPKVGDVLMTTEAPLGEVANVDKENIALAQRIIKFRGKKGELNNYYLKYCICSSVFQVQLHLLSTGSTALGIKASRLSQLIIAIPPIDVQSNIADFLDQKVIQIDSAIVKKEQLIEKLTEYKKSLIYEAVTGKLEVV